MERAEEMHVGLLGRHDTGKEKVQWKTIHLHFYGIYRAGSTINIYNLSGMTVLPFSWRCARGALRWKRFALC